MTRPVLHNSPESSGKRRVRGGTVDAHENEQPETVTSVETAEIQDSSSKRQTLEDFLKSRKKVETEPVRTISSRMPESLLQRFESLRGDMTRTDFLLSLIVFASDDTSK